jgi:hypothetical protein
MGTFKKECSRNQTYIFSLNTGFASLRKVIINCLLHTLGVLTHKINIQCCKILIRWRALLQASIMYVSAKMSERKAPIMQKSKFIQSAGFPINPFTARCENAMSLWVLRVLAPCKKFNHTVDWIFNNFWSTESICNRCYAGIVSKQVQTIYRLCAKELSQTSIAFLLLNFVWSPNDFGVLPSSRLLATSAGKGLTSRLFLYSHAEINLLLTGYLSWLSLSRAAHGPTVSMHYSGLNGTATNLDLISACLCEATDNLALTSVIPTSVYMAYHRSVRRKLFWEIEVTGNLALTSLTPTSAYRHECGTETVVRNIGLLSFVISL